MNDFEFDCLQKKRLAQQAKYRKCGSRSKKCPMSTDHMANKQWIERCGKIVSIKMDSPISWASFKELSKQTQEDYIKRLMEKYKVNATSLAEMFHVKPLTVRRHIISQGLDISFPVGHSMNTRQKQEWGQFIAGEQGGSEKNENDAPDNQTENKKRMSINSFSLRVSGQIDIPMIANSLIRILGNHSAGEVEIICNLE